MKFRTMSLFLGLAFSLSAFAQTDSGINLSKASSEAIQRHHNQSLLKHVYLNPANEKILVKGNSKSYDPKLAAETRQRIIGVKNAQSLVISTGAENSLSANSKFATVGEALVMADSCYSSISYEQVLESNTDQAGNVKVTGTSYEVIIDIDYSTTQIETDYVTTTLYAENIYTGELLLLGEEELLVDSGSSRSPSLSVIFNIDSGYANEWYLFATVQVDDQLGTACVERTGTIQL